MPIPTLPAFFDMYYTKDDGKLASDGYLYNDQLFQSLNIAVILLNGFVSSAIINNSIVNNGIAPPSKTTIEISAFSTDTTIQNGTLWFNTDLGKLQVKTASGIIETVIST